MPDENPPGPAYSAWPNLFCFIQSRLPRESESTDFELWKLFFRKNTRKQKDGAKSEDAKAAVAADGSAEVPADAGAKAAVAAGGSAEAPAGEKPLSATAKAAAERAARVAERKRVREEKAAAAKEKKPRVDED